jgi:4-hydroxy-4-methyl-2-oxoglutarate aldolase
MQFPTFCINHTPRNYHYPESAEYGGINVPIACGNIIINPGDVIFGDYDGVVVIPLEQVENLAEEVRKNLLKEIKYRREMKTYVPFDEEYHVKEQLLKRGYKFID